MSKRNFSVDTTSLSASKALLDSGYYSGNITGATIEGKEGKQFFKVREVKKWDKDSGTMIATGGHEPTGMLMFSVILNSKRAIKTLLQDEPRIFGGMFFFTFNDDYVLDLANNVQLGKLLSILGLSDTNFGESVDFEFDDDIVVPEEQAGIANIVELLNSVEYAKQLVTVICQTINDLPVQAVVVKQATRNDASVQENCLSMGTRNAPSCGIIAYEDGCEEDLEE